MSDLQQSAADEADLAVRMSRIVTALMGARGLKAAEVCLQAGIPKATWYRRMADGQWSPWQLVVLASILRVDVAAFFEDPDELIRSR